VSLERGSVRVPIYKTFLGTDTERKHVMRRTILATARREMSSILFPAKEGPEGNSLRFDRHMKENTPQSVPPSRNG